ncbi:hypothetical protein BASA81_007190 [Batrachochytrium salamandrivorans]|nr:hypothetical protein BASA62_002023 [Batrachochytrium salamandrivorans]KAH9254772.1 hypothetical protein BASA81_007190 [Batrachochytrium salamandrivorans]
MQDTTASAFSVGQLAQAMTAAGLEDQVSKFPVATRHLTGMVPVDGGNAAIATQVIYMEFANLLVLLVTQTGKIGSLSLASMDAAEHGPGMFGSTDTTEPSASVKSLLGPRDSPMIHSLASHIISQITQSQMREKRSLLLGLSLNCPAHLEPTALADGSFKDTFQGIVQLVRDLSVI